MRGLSSHFCQRLGLLLLLPLPSWTAVSLGQIITSSWPPTPLPGSGSAPSARAPFGGALGDPERPFPGQPLCGMSCTSTPESRLPPRPGLGGASVQEMTQARERWNRALDLALSSRERSAGPWAPAGEAVPELCVRVPGAELDSETRDAFLLVPWASGAITAEGCRGSRGLGGER